MNLSKLRPKTELEQIKGLCKAQGFNFDDIKLEAEYDMVGNILSIKTNDVKLQNIIKSKGFTNT